jgi:hypothetical protein
MMKTRPGFLAAVALTVLSISVGCKQDKGGPSADAAGSAAAASSSPAQASASAPAAPEPKVVSGPPPVTAKVTTKIDKDTGLPFVEYTNVGTRNVTAVEANIEFFDASGKKIAGTDSNHSVDMKPGAKIEKVESAGGVDGKKTKGLIVDPIVISVDFDDNSTWRGPKPDESARPLSKKH